ncbi:fumarylacetoacetate hydrolase family protein [Flavobacterium agricola]|uniref:Fumarylacetoacetate hydrolase family protein n=1 Tax=Flavobacterium agricola TaxID=2870839 RepID=A0ABY6M280_9FLAO|nr:fumarylacetoacetate hydrolase family protein [Flavobacterium agricola]UYW01510.1 fumarylacetoacetate hydrolase family protein [Flavobacterium agricola]
MKIICIGRNYVDHIEELKNERPTDPVVFLKPDTAILPKQFPFYIPEFSTDVHYEVELVLKVSKVGKYIDQKFARNYYNEVGLGIDFTARDLQAQLKAKGLPWEKAKGFDGSAVLGNFMPISDYDALQNLDFELHKNEQVVQKGNANHMIWNFDEIVAYVSQFFTLKTGDLIFTGTPAGVGPVAAGDVLEGFIKNEKQFRLNIK